VDYLTSVPNKNGAHVVINRNILLIGGILLALLASSASVAAKGDDTPQPADSRQRPDMDRDALEALARESISAMNRYYLDLAERAETGGEARELLAASALVHQAAISASFVDFKQDLSGELRRAKLLERARAAGPDDPLVLWVATVQPCDKSADECASDLRRLEQIDADNAAVWMLASDRAKRSGDAESARVAIARAAQSHRFDDYLWSYNLTFLQVLLAAPPVPSQGSGKSEQAYAKVAMSLGLPGSQASPPFETFAQACMPKGAATTDPSLRADCLAVAKILATGNGSRLSWWLGLSLCEKLDSDADRATRCRRDLRTSEWLVSKRMPALNALAQTSAGGEQLVHLMTQAKNEVGFDRSLLAQAGIPAEPPALRNAETPAQQSASREPPAAHVEDDDSPVDETLKIDVPKALKDPAMAEVSGEGNTDGVITLLSTSFELAPGADRTTTSPFIQSAALPWGRDARARSGHMAINVIPNGNPGNLAYFDQTVSAALLNSRLSGEYVPFQVAPYRRIELEFWRLSSSNPSKTHNCLGSLKVEYRFDKGPWETKMVYCGKHKPNPPEWKRSLLDFDTAGHKEMEFQFDYEYPPDTNMQKDAVYLLDDLAVHAYR